MNQLKLFFKICKVLCEPNCGAAIIPHPWHLTFDRFWCLLLKTVQSSFTADFLQICDLDKPNLENFQIFAGLLIDNTWKCRWAVDSRSTQLLQLPLCLSSDFHHCSQSLFNPHTDSREIIQTLLIFLPADETGKGGRVRTPLHRPTSFPNLRELGHLEKGKGGDRKWKN